MILADLMRHWLLGILPLPAPVDKGDQEERAPEDEVGHRDHQEHLHPHHPLLLHPPDVLLDVAGGRGWALLRSVQVDHGCEETGNPHRLNILRREVFVQPSQLKHNYFSPVLGIIGCQQTNLLVQKNWKITFRIVPKCLPFKNVGLFWNCQARLFRNIFWESFASGWQRAFSHKTYFLDFQDISKMLKALQNSNNIKMPFGSNEKCIHIWIWNIVTNSNILPSLEATHSTAVDTIVWICVHIYRALLFPLIRGILYVSSIWERKTFRTSSVEICLNIT